MQLLGPLKRSAAALILMLAATAAASAQTPPRVTLFAAGSLKGALVEIVAAFARQTGIGVDQTYGSSGLLRAQIENGTPADVFASADVGNPQRLHDAGKAGPVTVFVHNRMCLLVKSEIAGTRGVAEIMLDPAVRLITSTPKADPAGDYAETIFAKIDASHPGSLAVLDAKALRLVGGPNAAPIPPGVDPAVYLLRTTDQGDAFLAYCSGFAATAAANPTTLRTLAMPPALTVRADYGVTIGTGAAQEAMRLRDYLLSDAAQAVFERYGFARM